LGKAYTYLSTMGRKKTVDIVVGPSGTQQKTISLPGVRKVDAMPINPQQADWRDRFSIYVNKNQSFVVERIDAPSGWGQNLVLRCTVRDEEGKSADSGRWVQLEGAATSVGVDDWGNLVCCNAGGTMYEKNSNERGWRQIDGAATMVARGRDGTTWCVNKEQQIWRRDGGRWNQMPGAAVFVSVGSANEVIVINSAQQIFKWHQNNWQALDGAALRGSIGSDGTLFVVNSGGEIFRRDGGRWTKTSAIGHMPAVVDRGLVYVTNPQNQLFKSKDGGVTWKPLEGKLVHAAAAKGHFVGVNASQQLWHMRT